MVDNLSAPTFVDLQESTCRFFDRHWHAPTLGSVPPTWACWSEFKGSVPNHQYSGCYALFEGHTLTYVGLGASRGGGLYPEHGISRRLMAHVIRSDRERGDGWAKLRPGWERVTTIYTIGFPSEVAYIAPALESFLIRDFSGRLRNARV